MDSFFAIPTPKKGRVLLMLGTSLLLHGGAVGIATMWKQPEPPLHSVVLDLGTQDELPGSSPTKSSDISPTLPTESVAPTATPDEVVEVEPTPTEPTENPDFATPVEHTPPPRRTIVSATAPAVRSAVASFASHPGSGEANTAIPGGTNAGAANSVGGWVTPPPPYPHMNIAVRPTGATTVRITTDASGRISNVVILRSAGSPVLDNQTENYVRMNWHGPPNSGRTTVFVYQIR